MRIILILGVFLMSVAAQAIPILKFTSDRTSYVLGERAILRTHLATEPSNSTLEFHVVVKDELGAEITLGKLSDREFMGFTDAFSIPGTKTYTAEVFLQNRRIAASLVSAINFYSAEILRIDGLLASESDPQVIEALLLERASNVNKRAAAQGELTLHRKQVGGAKILEISVL